MAESDADGGRIGADTGRTPLWRTERYWALLVMTLVYAINVADRFVVSTLIEPIKADFHLSDSAVGFLTGVAFALCYAFAGLPLGVLADRTNRRNLIAWALIVWTLFTALGGLAHTMWQFLAARIGVGVGEAGATPASHSLLADHFPPRERALAMSIFALGIAGGAGLGGIAGGLLADLVGWRHSLLFFAALNLPVLYLLSTIREPRRGTHDAVLPPAMPVSAAPSLMDGLRFAWRQPALRHILIAGAVADFAGGGLAWWTPAFLSRSHGLSIAEAGLQVGLMSGLGGALALAAGALVVMRLPRDDASAICYFLAGLTGLITLPAIAAYAVPGTGAALLLLWLFLPFINVHVGPTFGLLQNLSPANMRGATVAIFLFATNIANLAIAPQVIGILSDALAHLIAAPQHSLRIALALSALAGFWAAYHYWAAIRWFRRASCQGSR